MFWEPLDLRPLFLQPMAGLCVKCSSLLGKGDLVPLVFGFSLSTFSDDNLVKTNMKTKHAKQT
jgi:hypothetical protein